MLTLIKMKKVFVAAGLILAFSASHARAACMPWNPICIFKMILKASPGMPVFDFTSVPAMIPHIPAALLKEGQAKLKEVADNSLEKLRSGQLPSMSKIDFKAPDFKGITHAPNEEFSPLEAFPSMDSDDPMEIAKSVEVIFLRPGWNDKDAQFSKHDELLMKYYHGKFEFENVTEILGFVTSMQSTMDGLLTAMEDVQKQIDSADDLNKAQRANYAAGLIEYQLMVAQNQLEAVALQMDSVGKLKGFVLDNPVLSDIKSAAQDAANQAKNSAQDAANQAKNSAQNAANQAKNSAQDAMNQANASAQNAANQAKNSAQNAANQAKNSAQNAANQVKGAAQNAQSAMRNVANSAASAAGNAVNSAKSALGNAMNSAGSATQKFK